MNPFNTIYFLFFGCLIFQPLNSQISITNSIEYFVWLNSTDLNSMSDIQYENDKDFFEINTNTFNIIDSDSDTESNTKIKTNIDSKIELNPDIGDNPDINSNTDSNNDINNPNNNPITNEENNNVETDTDNNIDKDKNVDIKTLKKYGTIRVPFDDYMISFDSSGFNDGEEMHFKIKAENESYIDEGIYYQYIGANVPYDEEEKRMVKYDIKTDYETIGSKKYKIKYFTIKKNKNEFRGTNGDLLIIEFYFDYGTIEITNTEEDEGKFETWKIIVIVAAVVVVIGIGVGLYCYRRKKELAAKQSEEIGQISATNQQNPPQVVIYNNRERAFNQRDAKYGDSAQKF